MSGDDALHDEREEARTLRATSPMPSGDMVHGVWYPDAPSRAEADADAEGER